MMQLDFWYRELVYFQKGVEIEKISRSEPDSRPTPTLLGAYPVTEISQRNNNNKENNTNKECARKRGRDDAEIVYEEEEGEFDDRLDGIYWKSMPGSRSSRRQRVN